MTSSIKLEKNNAPAFQCTLTWGGESGEIPIMLHTQQQGV